MQKLSIEQMQEMIVFTAREITGKKEELTRIDAQVGDGDHGIGMKNGFENVINTIRGQHFESVNELYRKTGMAMLNTMGGASGVIFSSLFLGSVKGMDDFDTVDGKRFARMWRKALDSIQKRGGAKPGDKTMVDALEPATVRFEELSAAEEDMTVIMKEAAAAAQEGMEKTKQYVAKFGRAKSLMERAVGYQDAGATSTYFIFDAMARWMEKEDRRLAESRERIVIGCDNAALRLKAGIIRYLEEKEIPVEDVGCNDREDTTPYPEIAERVCRKIQDSGYSRKGILLCGTGIGMAITANKFKGIRAAVCHDVFSTERSVLSNNCNVMCMGERVIGTELAKKHLDEWIGLEFLPGPSSEKLQDISRIERMNMK